MKKFYLHDGLTQTGPFDIDDLKSKGITAKTPIWHEGLQDWTTADKVEELSTYFSLTTPPPFTGTNAQSNTGEPESLYIASPPINTTKNTRNKFILLKIAILVIILGIVFYRKINPPLNRHYINETTYQEKVMSVEEIERSHPLDFYPPQELTIQTFGVTNSKSNAPSSTKLQ